MGTYSPGAFGPFNGTIGHVTATKWKRLNVVKNKPTKFKGQISAAQSEQRNKFGLVATFLSGMSEFISIGYRSVKGAVTPMNVAIKTVMEKNVLGMYPDYKLDYPKISLTLTSSKMDYTAMPAIEAKAGNAVKISWLVDPNATENTKPTDRAYIVLYSERLLRYVFFKNRSRSTLGIEATLPGTFAGEEVHCWIFFASADKKISSPTDYLGKVTLIK